MKKVISMLMLGIMLLSVACSGPTEEGGDTTSEGGAVEVIKIGVFEPMTGANAAGGEMEVEGIRLANELYPEVNGMKVELVVADNKSDKVEAANAAVMLIDKEKVNAIIGSWGSSLSMAAGPIVLEKQIPTVAASATNPLVTIGNEYYQRVCFIDSFQGTVMAKYAFETLGAKKAAIIQEISSDYSVGLVKYFNDAFIELTGDADAIIGTANYSTGDQDFSAQLSNIKQLNPDVIFAPGNYTESALLIKQARELGITTPFIGGDTWEAPEFLEIGGDAVEGAAFSTFFTSDVPITKESETFLDAYRAKYDKEPASVTALGYDAYLVILDAIKRSGSTDPVEIQKALATTTDFEGAAGMITLDENGDAVKSAVIKMVEGGLFKYMTTVEPIK
ncbi:ABC transporter substrate-binding protein [Petrocella sp. FN5]|uniref:ABC transporter substrate-binding protein n=1 Tax=Petrocella sp. FN5 TaxID=3032002 RepID=UPI0023D9986D|nr:ABC transporter substrate-binding protein [Petrocella sp. FN5]MDF1616218.1 ABC transporter substrate-binding protein [Petrocella sp. FN5]